MNLEEAQTMLKQWPNNNGLITDTNRPTAVLQYQIGTKSGIVEIPTIKTLSASVPVHCIWVSIKLQIQEKS